MSSSDRARQLRSLGRMSLIALAGALALAACTVRPLYGPAPSGAAGTTTVAALAGIAVDPVTTRVAQQVRNRLIFSFAGGREPSTPAYHLRLSVSSAEGALGITPVESAPTYSITVSVTYELTVAGTGAIVLRGTSRGTASFDRVNQVYANTRAKLDAENRAATLAADDIQIRMASAAAKGTI